MTPKSKAISAVAGAGMLALLLSPGESDLLSDPTRGTACEPSYPTVCIPIGASDYDCAGGQGNGPNYIQGPIRVRHDVPRSDPHGLDRDGDGIACEPPPVR